MAQAPEMSSYNCIPSVISRPGLWTEQLYNENGQRPAIQSMLNHNVSGFEADCSQALVRKMHARM